MKIKSGEWQGFPYAIHLAEDRGATRVHLQPRLEDPSISGEVHPDVYGERPGKKPIIVEVEDSVGQKFKRGGTRHRESLLRRKAEFVFILGERARGGCEKRLREYFGPSVELLYLTDLVQGVWRPSDRHRAGRRVDPYEASVCQEVKRSHQRGVAVILRERGVGRGKRALT